MTYLILTKPNTVTHNHMVEITQHITYMDDTNFYTAVRLFVKSFIAKNNCYTTGYTTRLKYYTHCA